MRGIALAILSLIFALYKIYYIHSGINAQIRKACGAMASALILAAFIFTMVGI